MASYDSPGRSIKTAETVFGIIESIKESDGGKATELAERLDLAPSTVYDHLTTLEALGVLVKRDEQYELSLKFLDYGIIARNNIDFLDTVRAPMKDLAEETGENVWLYIEEHGRGVVVEKEAGEQAVETVGRLGFRPYLHTTAAGKAILAHLPRKRVEAVIDRYGLPQRTEETITTPERLFDELETIREHGFALNYGETNERMHAVGAPIVVEGEVLGAISLSGPVHRLSGEWFEETLPNRILDITSRVEVKLSY